MQELVVPKSIPKTLAMASASPAAPQELTDLQRKLKENESQRTEVTGYINQLSIQLHRWKLRLQTLNERKTELEEELRKPT
jgi:chromosome segregation ATPase